MAHKDTKHPARPFNEAAKGQEREIVFEPDFDEKLLDNTDPRQEPSHKSTLQRTPSGTRSFFKPPQQTEQSSEHSTATESLNQPSNEEFQNELLNGDYTFEDEIGEFRIRTKIEDEQSKMGINGGMISRMVLTNDERGSEVELARFEKGEWLREAKSTPQRQCIMEAMNRHDADSLKQKKQIGDKTF